MTFDKSMVKDVDQATVEGVDVQFPLVQWGYGNVKLARNGGIEGAGGFFVTLDNMPAAIKDEMIESMNGLGWGQDGLTLNDGSLVDGMYSPSLTFSLITMRKRWRASDGNGRTEYYPFTWAAYERAIQEFGRATSQIHVLAYIRGLEEYSPFVITMSGSAAMSFEGTKKMPGVLSSFNRTVVAAANAATRGYRWPYRAFWVTVAAATDAKKKPLFTEVGTGSNTTSVVLPVAVGLPTDPKDVDLDKFALDKPDFQRVQDLYSDSVAWKAAWDEKPTEPGTQGRAVPGQSDDVDFRRDAVAAAAADAGL